MKKRCITILCLLLALMTVLPAAAEPVISSAAGYTACIGENNYLYLTDPDQITKVLQTPIASLDGITEEFLYCTTADGRHYEVRLDGTSSRIVTEQITWPAPAFTLEENVLIPHSESGMQLSGIPNVVAACSTPEAIYYVTTSGTTHTLMRLALPLADNALPVGEVLVASVKKPLSMLATPEAVTIVSEGSFIDIINLPNLSTQGTSKAGEPLTHAYAYNNKLVCLSLGEQGQYTVLSSEAYTPLTPEVMAAMLTPAPTAVVTAAPTVKPTATPKPTKAPTVEEDDGRISFGDTGSDVRKMQRRLLELGYPVGKVDGDFGENTLLAVNLFQCAINYRNRRYASEAMLTKLYSKKAPVYDPYAPLKEGDEGADVKIMQTFLDDLGYSLGEKGIDGKYGKDTKTAVEQFQFVAGLEVTGEADAETLKKLYDEKNPIPNATATPVPPTEQPTETPTEQPTEVPTETPTELPTEGPTQGPSTPTDL